MTDTQPIRILRISGRFTDEDLKRFADLLREIDRDRPTELFTMTFVGGDETLEEGEALVQSLLPPLAERITTFQTFKIKPDGA